MKSKLSRMEEKIMKLIWDHGEDISIPELIDSIRSNYGMDYARTTVATFLKRMSEKGYVATYRKGRKSYTHALISLKEYRKELLETVYVF